MAESLGMFAIIAILVFFLLVFFLLTRVVLKRMHVSKRMKITCLVLALVPYINIFVLYYVFFYRLPKDLYDRIEQLEGHKAGQDQG